MAAAVAAPALVAGPGFAAGSTPALSLSLLDLIHNEITAVTSELRRNLNRRGFASSAAYTQAAALALHTTFHGLPPLDPATADPELVAIAGAALPVLTPSTLVSTTTMSLTMPALSAAARTFANFQQRQARGGTQLPSAQALGGPADPATSKDGVASGPAEGAGAGGDALASTTPRTPLGPGAPPPPTDDPLSLLTRFVLLRAQLRTHSATPGANLSTFPLPFLVEPFLKVVLSPKTTGTTTAIALASVQRFIVHGIIPAPRLVRDADALPRLAPSAEQGSLPNVAADIAHALSHSRFEASTPASAETGSSDELVLVRILDLMRVLICPAVPGSHVPALADLLSDGAICELMETGLSMCCQTRLSELLRKTAQAQMTEMLGAIFRRLENLPVSPSPQGSLQAGQEGSGTQDEASASGPSAEGALAASSSAAAGLPPSGPTSPTGESRTHMRRMTMPDPKSLAIPAAATAEALSAVSEEDPEQEAGTLVEDKPSEKREGEVEQGDVSQADEVAGAKEKTGPPTVAGSVVEATRSEPPRAIAKPYGLPAINEILRVLAYLIDPHDSNNNDTMRLLSMQLLTPLLESNGAAISRFPDLRALLTDVAAKHLFQLARTSPGPSSGSGLTLAAAEANAMQLQMVGASLRAITTLFAAMKPFLKLQFELFVAFCLDRLAPTFPFTMEPWNEGALAVAAARKAQAPPPPIVPVAAGGDSASAPPPPPPPPPPMPKTSERAPATGETRELTLETFNMLFRGFERHGTGVAIPSVEGAAGAGASLAVPEGALASLAGSGVQTPTIGGQIAVEDVMVTLWVNYDCDAHCEDLYDRVVRFLCRAIHATNPAHAGNAGSGSGSDTANGASPALQDGTQVLALDAILNLISGMAGRQEALDLEAAASPPVDVALDARTLSERKQRKGLILDAANRFNAKPKVGVKWMAERGLIVADGSEQEKAKSLAAFLKGCPGLDKKLLGDFISRPDNLQVLEAFISLFDFHGKSIADALRELLETFRLPGESQQIARITETFAKIFFAHKPPEIASEDATYVLSYSVIMLNTDQHNPQNKRKMQVEDYKKNLRGVNEGKDFDPEYLNNIFESIKKREIVMPEEHLGQLGFEYAWKELVRRSRTSGHMLPCGSADFDRPMFENSWQPIVASLAHAFSSFQDEYLLERAITGFRQCATLARKFGMNDVFDFMVHGLSAVTGLLDDGFQGPRPNATNPQVDIEGQKITVSPLSIRFGMNFKGQLAAVVLFTIANGNGDAIRSSWTDIFEIFKNLFANQLLPESMLSMLDFSVVNGRSRIPLKAKKLPGVAQHDARSQGGGLFSTLSSYLLAPMSAEKEAAPQDVTEQDVESSLSTVDCVASCNLEELYEQIKHLKGDALLAAVRSLKGLAERLVSQASKSDAGGTGTSTPTQASVAQNRALSSPRYDASAVFVMEMFVEIACGDADVLPHTWHLVYDFIATMLSAPKVHHPLMVERAVVLALRLVQKASVLASESADDTSELRGLRDQLFLALDTVRSLPAELRSIVSLQLLGGLVPIVSTTPSFARSSTEWGLLLALIGEHSKRANASAIAVRLGMQAVSEGISVGVTAENILGFLGLLRDYASEAELNAANGGGAAATSSPGSRNRSREPPARQTLTEKKELAEADEARRERAVEAVAALESLRHKIPSVVSSTSVPYADAWKQTWVTLLGALLTQCLSSHRPLRQAAITHSQRAFLCSEILPAAPVDIRPIFDQVLFPVLDELTKPVVIQRDPGPGGMQEVRLRLCALACKLFLHLLSPLAESTSSDADLQEVWLTLLDFFDRFVNVGKKDQLAEAIPENLKNVLLVMSASGVLLPPPPAGQPDQRTQRQAVLWAVTFDRLKRFLPGLQEEVFPPLPPPPPPAAASAPAPESGAPEAGEAPVAVPASQVEEAEAQSAASEPTAAEAEEPANEGAPAEDAAQEPKAEAQGASPPPAA
ncbi:GDP/GTP exchange factor for ARF [Tilletia horrida]|uniref:GDP/GTP exchange factor for ARF n=1 Tax=Tilletia horrida TaxID=155126 RepID=A0AAN6GHE4_9BASI|nr:GDP/GTP exchange factor for ARF [Tilletia horrida]